MNPAAGQILGTDLETLVGISLDDIQASEHAILRPFFGPIRAHLADPQQDWSEHITVFGATGRLVLMCRGTSLSDAVGDHAGHVIVFDDITAMIKGQRDAAWSEVARRLAHEIKNPLTPIQLSAERLRHKFANKLPEADGKTLRRLTTTIVQQVEIMKGMVDTFAEYARPPRIQRESIALNPIVEEILELYRSMDPDAHIVTDLTGELPAIHADQGRIRQVLNNVVKNALEAAEPGQPAQLSVSTSSRSTAGENFVELRFTDQGCGIPDKMLDNIFEPYVSTKPKGTGLGLAIVKKIVEEHSGVVWMVNNPQAGVSVTIRLPIAPAAATADNYPSRQSA